jgi:hypothetical protein
VDTDAAGGASSGAGSTTDPYGSLSYAEAQSQADLTTELSTKTFRVKGSTEESGAVVFSSADWTTSATYYVIVERWDSDGSDHGLLHQSAWDTSSNSYRITSSATTGTLQFDGVDFACRGLQVSNSSGATGAIGINGDGSGLAYMRIENCLIQKTTNDLAISACRGIFNRDATGTSKTVIIVNNTIFGASSSIHWRKCIDLETAASDNIFCCYNTTDDASDANHNFYFAGATDTVTRVNNISTNGGADDYWDDSNSITTRDEDYNLSSDLTAPDDGGGNSLTSKTVTYTSQYSDYSLAAGDTSGAKTGGQDLSAHGTYAVSTDAIGVTRDGSTPSMGAFEFVAAGGGGIIPLVRHRQMLGFG